MYKSNWPVFNDVMISNVSDILKSGKVNQWTGSKVFEFQDKFSKYFGVEHSIAVFNGSVAIELCLKAIDLQLGDEVIVTPRTFIASASSVTVSGGVPVFVDVDKDSQNITLESIKTAVTDRTKAVILVHLAGWPCDVEEIVDFCHSKNIWVIEDCAQSHGAKYNGKYLGTFGDINAWSFCQDKIISTGGEGGMVTTNNNKLAKLAWSYKDHGKDYDLVFNGEKAKPGMFKWVHNSIGTNWRMTEIQASIGIDSLNHLKDWIDTRRSHAAILNTMFSKIPYIRCTIPDKRYYHAYYKYYCFVIPELLPNGLTRDVIIQKINDAGIPCFQGTCGEVYREKAYDLNLKLPVTAELTRTSLMFLIDPTYTTDKIIEISNIIYDILI